MFVNGSIFLRYFVFEGNVTYAFISGSGRCDNDKGNDWNEEENINYKTLNGIGDYIFGRT